MANQRYGLARQAFAAAQIDWVNDDIRAILIDTGVYTPNFNTDEFLTSVPSGARKAVAALSGKTNVLGVLDANDITFSSVSAFGGDCEAILLYKHTGSDATSRLIAWIDTASGLPVTPNGGDVDVVWDNGANKIMAV